MKDLPWTIRGLRATLASGAVRPTALAEQALERANSNPGHNVYLWQDREWTLEEAKRAEESPQPSGEGSDAIWGLPASVKDCFDLAGAPTTCGVRFYRDLNGIVEKDSWVVKRLRTAGAVIVGKTHLHPLAYGITGENPEFRDCLQPRNPSALTGGSSSGAAASVQEGSAVFAIGTDTGGSIRVPAALCGLAGYRASHGRGTWTGVAHLAESFDTMGCLFRDLEDTTALTMLFSTNDPHATASFKRFAVVGDSFLHDCEPEIRTSLHSTIRELESLGLSFSTVNVDWWTGAFEIFAPIQASEAARIHAGYFDHFEPSIRDRLEWGARIAPEEIAVLRQRHAAFRQRMDELFAKYDLLLLPAAPVTTLIAGADHSQTRARLLRYTTPFSLAGVPVITIPCGSGGMQLAAARGKDEALAQLASTLGAQRNASTSVPHP